MLRSVFMYRGTEERPKVITLLKTFSDIISYKNDRMARLFVLWDHYHMSQVQLCLNVESDLNNT